jgi:hypothetical protein
MITAGASKCTIGDPGLPGRPAMTSDGSPLVRLGISPAGLRNLAVLERDLRYTVGSVSGEVENKRSRGSSKMASNWNRAILATVAIGFTMAFAAVPAAVSQGLEAPQGHLYSPPYMPGGHVYAPGEDRLPPINSRESFFNSQVDILQTEIYRRNYEQSMFESEMGRHDLRGGPLLGPDY